MYIGLNRDRVTTILHSVLAELYEKISGQFDEVRVSVFLPLSLNHITVLLVPSTLYTAHCAQDVTAK